MMISLSKTNSALDLMISKARAIVEAMTPEQLAALREEQRQSFARGMAPCYHGKADWEQCPACGEDHAANKRAARASEIMFSGDA